ncbi:MAG: beta-ribofuranosylaminobenzene 5'-phosphate synthase family protein [Candidatus Thermoplasmatota archaeon]
MKIKTPSRLHFGIIDLSREFSRKYGAFGITLRDGYEIEMEPIEDGIHVEGSEREKKIAKKVHRRLREKFDIADGFEIVVNESIPNHVGLGSTTQFTLGTGYGILKECGEEISIKKLAKMLGRGRFSAIGTHGFENGGFILEGGKVKEKDISPMLKRKDVPEDWRFLIICPEQEKGYDEKEEKPIMEDLTVNRKYPEKICHNLLMGVLPSLEGEDIESFGEHLTKIQELVGESFSDYQEGIYHPVISDIVKSLIDSTYGGGQSSWGPTAYGLVREKDLDGLKNKVLEGKKEENYRVWIGEPNNEGVIVKD